MGILHKKKKNYRIIIGLTKEKRKQFAKEENLGSEPKI